MSLTADRAINADMIAKAHQLMREAHQLMREVEREDRRKHREMIAEAHRLMDALDRAHTEDVIAKAQFLISRAPALRKRLFGQV